MKEKVDTWFVDSISVINLDFAVVRLIKECDYIQDVLNYNIKSIVVPTSLLEEDFLDTKKEFLEEYYRDNKKSCVRSPYDPCEGIIKQGATYDIYPRDFNTYSILAEKMGLK